jgi:hypothetical protein
MRENEPPTPKMDRVLGTCGMIIRYLTFILSESQKERRKKAGSKRCVEK